MRNLLQDQLLKAGLVKKAKVDQVAREQTRQRQGKAPVVADEGRMDAQRAQAERVERDRALAAAHNAQLRAAELRAQVRQIVDAQKVRREGEIAYRFTDGERIASVLVNESMRAQLASGLLVIARRDDGYELLPRSAAEKVYARDASAIVLDHAGARHSAEAIPPANEDDAYYSQFKVPDDLVW
ncbi:MAG: DUF2058 domain-containing protein [Dokdonella sp.]|uniref:DUF2058 domain-containing protein n=1 Tax=Dokdonella sp. TaxID=2291710 RepID=UPI00326750EB